MKLIVCLNPLFGLNLWIVIRSLRLKKLLLECGLVSRKEGETKPTLWQSGHILHKRGQYAIVHFKQLFLLDGRSKQTDFTPDDIERIKLIAWLLQDWGLIKIKKQFEVSETSDVVVISFSEKQNWNCKAKYTMGKIKKTHSKNEDYV